MDVLGRRMGSDYERASGSGSERRKEKKMLTQTFNLEASWYDPEAKVYHWRDRQFLNVIDAKAAIERDMK